jgi:hypothetical protein
MADSDAVRAQRYRMHKAGNHGLCRPGCGQRAPKPAEMTGVAGAQVDPGAGLIELAATLRAAHLADPGNALLAREYRLTLQAIGPGERVDGELERMFAAFPGRG